MYKYKLRPGYKSSELLIEFFIKAANDDFKNTLFQALESLNSQQKGATNLWMNDEVLIQCDCELGSFEISLDIWDGVFIMSPNNQGVIFKIDEILSKHNKFIKLEVDFSAYK